MIVQKYESEEWEDAPFESRRFPTNEDSWETIVSLMYPYFEPLPVLLDVVLLAHLKCT